MQCFIYKSPKKTELYLYMAVQDDFSTLPESMLNMIGTPEYVMCLELTATRKLAREQASDVIKGIEKNGFFIQMPPSIDTLNKTLQ